MSAISRAVFELIIQRIHKMRLWSNSLGAVPGLRAQVRVLYWIFSALNPGMYLRVDKIYFNSPHCQSSSECSYDGKTARWGRVGVLAQWYPMSVCIISQVPLLLRCSLDCTGAVSAIAHGSKRLIMELVPQQHRGTRGGESCCFGL